MRRCSQCAELVQDDAKICRHCQHRFTLEETNEARDERRRGTVMRLLLVVGAFVLLIYYLSTDEGMSSLVNLTT